jgi:CBS domain-containing protein
MKVKDVMVSEVTTVTPNASLKDVAAMLVERGISGVPVVGSVREVLGVVSEADILMKEREPSPRRSRLLGLVSEPENLDEVAKLKARTAGDAMTAPAITIGPESSLTEAAGLMVDRGINRLPVVENGKLVGIVTRADLVRAFTRSDADIEREVRDDVVLGYLFIDPERVQVSVERGVVTLSGTVENETDANMLANAVRRIPGVVSVKSSLSWSSG